MKTIYKLFSIFFIAMFVVAPVSIPDAKAEEGSCYLQATNTDVFIVVFDMDRDGNKGQKIWQGRINANHPVKISTPHGRFVYDYNSQPDQDQPLSGGTERWCRDDETVLVP